MKDSGNTSSNLSSLLNALSLTAGVKRSLANEQILEALYFREALPPDWQLGKAIDNGDCFYDALAQALSNNMQRHSIKSLRKLCSDYIRQLNQEANWVKTAIEKDGCVDDYLAHVATVQYTQDEMNQLKKDSRAFTGYAIWGKPHIEGRIIASKLKITIHLIEYHDEKEGGIKITPIHQLITGESAKTVGKIEISYHDSRTIHLAIYRDHFVPVLNNLPKYCGFPFFSHYPEKSEIAHVQEEMEVDKAALASQRSIETIEINRQFKTCLIIPAVPDENCGFTATRLCLLLQKKEELASYCHRQLFIQLVREIMQDPVRYEQFKDDILNMLREDGAANFIEWEDKFKSAGYWLQGSHFAFLSYFLNIRFNFYYLPPNESCFRPEPSYETIYYGENSNNVVTITLAHMCTQLKDRLDATLNHFDGILIEPTEAQKEEIMKFIKKEEEETLINNPLKDIIKKLTVAHVQKDYKLQSEIYPLIAQFYLNKEDYISAISIYNFALGAYNKWARSLLKKNHKHSNDSSFATRIKEKILWSIKNSEHAYLNSIGIDYKLNSFPYEKVYCLHREYLADLRQQVQEQLNSNLMPINKIYKNISASIKEFIIILVKQCIQILGEPPCSYALIGLGSLARDEATPYSDFEWAILIGNEHCSQYFIRLTELMNIKVLNLGETSPKIAYIDQKYFSFTFGYDKNPVYKGFAFDSKDPSGCKFPLGNKHLPHLKQFELIQTPANMLKYQSDEWFNYHRTLPTILNNTTFIMGEYLLFNQYQLALREYLTPPVREFRAKQLLHIDVLKFEPRVGKLEKDGRVFPIKYDLYRLPNLVFDGLALYHKLNSTSTIERIDGLKNFLNPVGAQRLKYCFEKILKWRLQNYLKKGEQSDDLFITNNQSEKLKELYEVYDILRYLMDFAYDFAVNNRNRFISSDFSTEDPVIKIIRYEKLHDYDKIIEICTDLLKIPLYLFERIQIGFYLGKAFLDQGRFKEAISIFKQLASQNTPYMKPILLTQYAKALGNIGEYKKALKQLAHAEEALVNAHNIPFYNTLSDKQNMIIQVFYCYGVIYLRLNQFKNAINYLEKAIEEELSITKGAETSELFLYQGTLGCALAKINKFKKAHELLDKCINNAKNQFGAFHPNVASSLCYKTKVLFKQKKFNEALKYAQEALQIYLNEKDNKHAKELGHLLDNMANIYIELGNNKSALNYIDLSLLRKIKVYGDNHSETIKSRFIAMRIYWEMGHGEKAIELFNKLKGLSYLQKELYLKAHLYICGSNSFLQLLKGKNKNRNLEEALSYAENAIKIIDSLFKKEGYTKYLKDLATFLNTKGTIFTELEKYKSAEKCFNDSISKFKEISEAHNHSGMITCYINLGALYVKKHGITNDLRTALDYFGKALQIHKEIYKNDSHRLLIKIYELIAETFCLLNEFDEALHYHRKSGDIALQFGLKKQESFEDLQRKYPLLYNFNASKYNLNASDRLRKNVNKGLIKNIKEIDYSLRISKSVTTTVMPCYDKQSTEEENNDLRIKEKLLDSTFIESKCGFLSTEPTNLSLKKAKQKNSQCYSAAPLFKSSTDTETKINENSQVKSNSHSLTFAGLKRGFIK